ncbi:hypothetical protein NHX12_011527, partial [Muraenolepis orangiensis]
MVTVLEELATDKSMDGVIASVKQVSLSLRSATRRIEALSDAVQGAIINGVSQANLFSIAIDERKDFREERLSLIALEGQTTGDVIFMKLEELFRLHSMAPGQRCAQKCGVYFDPNLGMMMGIPPMNPLMHGLGMVPPPMDMPIIKEIIHCKSCTLFLANPRDQEHAQRGADGHLVEEEMEMSDDDMESSHPADSKDSEDS